MYVLLLLSLQLASCKCFPSHGEAAPSFYYYYMNVFLLFLLFFFHSFCLFFLSLSLFCFSFALAFHARLLEVYLPSSRSYCLWHLEPFDLFLHIIELESEWRAESCCLKNESETRNNERARTKERRRKRTESLKRERKNVWR